MELGQPPLWLPQRDSKMEHFRQAICERHGVQLKTYPDLHQWSINNLSLFWQHVWEFCDIVHSQPFEQVHLGTCSLTEKVVDEEKTIDSVPEWFRGAKLNFAENLLRFRDTRTAILYESELGSDSRSISYLELYSEVAKVAAALRSSGVGVNDVIAAFAGNVPEVVVFMLAAASIGAIFTTVPPDFGVTAVCDRLSQTSPRIVLASPSVYYNGKVHCQMDKVNQMVSQVSSIEKIVILADKVASDGPEDGKFVKYSQFIESFAVDALSFTQLPFNHPLYILYSSGTTGKPKCLVHSAGGTLIQHLKEHILHGDLTRSDVFLQYTNIGWMMWHWMVSVLAVGSTIVLYEGSPFKPETIQLWRLIEKHQVTRFGTSAKYIQHLQECDTKKSDGGEGSESGENGKSGTRTTSTTTNATTPATTTALIASFDISSLLTIYSTGSPLSPSDFRFVHDKIKADLQISSITGGTDIISLFGAGNPMLPVHAGEIQCPGLGMAVKAYSDAGEEVLETPGDLVCTRPFPSMPVAFWNDSDGSLYRNSYFGRFPQCWHHGDFVKFTKNGGLVMLGRSDSTLNPAGVRFGSAELYNVVARFPEVKDSLVVGVRKPDENDERVIMFLQTDSGIVSDDLAMQIKKQIRSLLSARHVPALILATPAIPYTLNGKKVEVAVKRILSGSPDITTVGLANSECLAFYRTLSL
ncbi:Acetyl-coenzyme A synthetase [Paramicrosporidium saccamoebae]|uniref:Acetyl-coenzyme A synthetase n=1 Tax=Paramicrosporidium saccamoebae TaxID=1246581 RepID=A0A2H9TG19_9FUNG|nr:Acetyl-coenzyme A synthetase [Paramicrosporidium saccamoebae]